MSLTSVMSVMSLMSLMSLSSFMSARGHHAGPPAGAPQHPPRSGSGHAHPARDRQGFEQALRLKDFVHLATHALTQGDPASPQPLFASDQAQLDALDALFQ